jgi:hypothetical protein
MAEYVGNFNDGFMDGEGTQFESNGEIFKG